MVPRARRLRTFALACLLAASPLVATAQTPPAAGTLSVSRDMPLEADETLRQWFKEQDRLLDDILLRLARIENLVRDIFRLVERLPDAAAPTRPAAAPPAAQTPLPPAMVIVPPPARQPSGVWGFFDQWGPLLAAAGMLLLLLLMARRRRAPVATAQTQAVPPAPTFEPPAAPPPRPAPPAAPAPTAVKAPPAPAAHNAQAAASPAPAAAANVPAEVGDQALELAEIMLSMGLGQGAAQTLIEQIRKEPKQALRHWLKLLEIYRRNGQEEEFRRSAEELRQYFNVQPEDWQPRPEAQRSLADYPHIAVRLTELWGKPGCLAYLQNLLDDNRGGARAGFPQSVAEELLLLAAMIKSGDIPG